MRELQKHYLLKRPVQIVLKICQTLQHYFFLTIERTLIKYFEKDIVERSFKQLKGALSLHPLRVWNLQNIQSNIKICYLAYTILSLISYRVKKLEISGVEALNNLNGGYKVYLEDKNTGNVVEKVITLKAKQEQILDALNVVYKN